ncbi:MAG: phosphotransferase family protein [Acidimicrobiales bacterium]
MSDSDDVIDVRAGAEFDNDALSGYLRERVGVSGDRPIVRQFAAGRANLTYLVEFRDCRLVVRRPPRGTIAPGAHDMAREARVLSRLPDAYPRAPRALAFCDDPTVIGSPFIVIEYREGLVVRDSVPLAMAVHKDVVRRIDLALIDAAADLHTLDVDAAGLADLGRPEGFGARQVSGWTDRWHLAAVQAVPVMDEVAATLAASVPQPTKVAILHNDLKLDNCQFHVDDPDNVTSVFDWDMATLGDPLFDLALLLTSLSGSRAVWVLSADEAISRYRERSGIDVNGMDWYLAFAAWRTAVVLQQLHNRYLSGDSTDPRLAEYGQHIGVLADRARRLLEQAN